MRKSLLGIVLAATLLPVSLVHAGVKEDLAAGKSVEQIVAEAQANGQDLQDVLGQIISAAPDKAYAALAAVVAASPSQAQSVSNFAVSKGLNPSTVNAIVASSTGSASSGSGSSGGGAFGGLSSSGFSGGVTLNSGFSGGGGGGGGGSASRN